MLIDSPKGTRVCIENSTIIIPPLLPSSKELQEFDSCYPINPDSIFFFNVKIFLSSKIGKAISLFEGRRAKEGQITRPASLGSFLASFLLKGQWHNVG